MKINESANDHNSALERFSSPGRNVPIDPSLYSLDALLESAEETTESNTWVDSIAGDNPTLWNFGTGDLNIPMGLRQSSTQPGLLEQSTVPHNLLPDNSHVHGTGLPCSCLATMYLAMSSLQDLPPEVGAALVIVRAAVNTAQIILRCEQCGRPMGTPVRPPLEAFQNTMLLGTLLPTIVNSYKRLLEMVDYEFCMAKSAGYQITLSISQDNSIYCLGGLSGENTSLEKSLVEPDEWRTAIRCILRDDIYGHEFVNTSLKGLISEMEQRQRKCHTKMDVLGHSRLSNGFQQKQCLNEKNAPCLQILNITKVAMGSLGLI
ncbi:hypothetical protein OIDMADRAFT_55316 [Oidiodendron maius Zn]|uniref:Uncharacterized protein n=1 Tax=Oidiodendron maius (strain Zn) TaxID=913774 RepID=A0A0C3CP25_OIDMZ|nr:hypothetical protein OIDMADRAFT_55316 [Oidiodendron maius Zn]